MCVATVERNKPIFAHLLSQQQQPRHIDVQYTSLQVFGVIDCLCRVQQTVAHWSISHPSGGPAEESGWFLAFAWSWFLTCGKTPAESKNDVSEAKDARRLFHLPVLSLSTFPTSLPPPGDAHYSYQPHALVRNVAKRENGVAAFATRHRQLRYRPQLYMYVYTLRARVLIKLGAIFCLFDGMMTSLCALTWSRDAVWSQSIILKAFVFSGKILIWISTISQGIDFKIVFCLFREIYILSR